MRIRYPIIAVVLCVVALITSNVLTATFVKDHAEKELLEDAYIQSMRAVGDYLDTFEMSESDNDKAYAATSWGTAVQIAFHFDESSRIFKERNLLNQIYFELLRDDSHISMHSISSICRKLEENPYDITAYAELNELLNTAIH